MLRQNAKAALPGSSLAIYGAIALSWSWCFWLISTLLRSQGSLIPGLIGAIATFLLWIIAILIAWKTRVNAR